MSAAALELLSLDLVCKDDTTANPTEESIGHYDPDFVLAHMLEALGA